MPPDPPGPLEPGGPAAFRDPWSEKRLAPAPAVPSTGDSRQRFPETCPPNSDARCGSRSPGGGPDGCGGIRRKVSRPAGATTRRRPGRLDNSTGGGAGAAMGRENRRGEGWTRPLPPLQEEWESGLGRFPARFTCTPRAQPGTHRNRRPTTRFSAFFPTPDLPRRPGISCTIFSTIVE